MIIYTSLYFKFYQECCLCFKQLESTNRKPKQPLQMRSDVSLLCSQSSILQVKGMDSSRRSHSNSNPSYVIFITKIPGLPLNKPLSKALSMALSMSIPSSSMRNIVICNQ